MEALREKIVPEFEWIAKAKTRRTATLLRMDLILSFL